MKSIFNAEDDSAAIETNNNTWKYLTVALAAVVTVGTAFYFGCLYLFPLIGTKIGHNGGAVDNAIGATFAGILGILIMIAVPVLAILIPAIIIGFGFGIGFGASGVGRALRNGRNI